jgi:hypothetical protein
MIERELIAGQDYYLENGPDIRVGDWLSID